MNWQGHAPPDYDASVLQVNFPKRTQPLRIHLQPSQQGQQKWDRSLFGQCPLKVSKKKYIYIKKEVSIKSFRSRLRHTPELNLGPHRFWPTYYRLHHWHLNPRNYKVITAHTYIYSVVSKHTIVHIYIYIQTRMHTGGETETKTRTQSPTDLQVCKNEC